MQYRLQRLFAGLAACHGQNHRQSFLPTVSHNQWDNRQQMAPKTAANFPEKITWRDLEHSTIWGMHTGRVELIAEWVPANAFLCMLDKNQRCSTDCNVCLQVWQPAMVKIGNSTGRYSMIIHPEKPEQLIRLLKSAPLGMNRLYDKTRSSLIPSRRSSCRISSK